MNRFQKEISDEEKRKLESAKLTTDFSDKVPVLIKPFSKKKNLYFMEQNRFLVPKMYTFHEFVYIIRKKLKLGKNDTLYMTVAGNHFPAMHRTMNGIYNEFKDPDGFLYVNYSSEAIWG
jgi:hypothetical protein